MDYIDRIVRGIRILDRRFAPQAYHFVLDSLEHTTRLAERDGRSAKDVSTTECFVISMGLAVDNFGPMAALVLRRWGISQVSDIRDIMVSLERAGLLFDVDADALDSFPMEIEQIVQSLAEQRYQRVSDELGTRN